MDSGYEESKRLINENKNKAIESFRKCIANGVQVVNSYCYLAKGGINQTKYDEALEEINKLLKISPYNSEGQFILGTLYMKQSKYLLAYKAFQSVTSIYSKELYQNICFGNFQLRRYIDSYNAIKTAIYYDEEALHGDKSKRDKSIQLYLIIACNYTEKYSEALSTIDNDGINYFPNDPTLIQNRAFALCEQKMLTECLEYCSKNNHLRDIPYYTAKCYYYQKNFNKANEIGNHILDEGTATSSLKERALYLKGKIQGVQNEEGNAIQTFTDALNCNPKNIDIIVSIASVYIKNGDNKRALDTLNRANNYIDYEIQQEYELYYVLIKAEVLFKLKRYNEGKELFDFTTKCLSRNISESCFVKSTFIKVLSKYFELYHYAHNYTKKDLEIDKSKEGGHGGFSTVYKGKLKGLDVAVKALKFKPNEDYEFETKYEEFNNNMNILFKNLLMINKEISIMEKFAKEKHHTLGIICLFYINGIFYLVLPLCLGGALGSTIKDKNITISTNRACEIGLQIADAIQFMHSFKPPYMHHDLKSLNVLLEEPYNDKAYNRVLVSDFGLTTRESTFYPGGTVGWAAPELFTQSLNYNESIDVFSFGMVIYEMFERQTPYHGMDKDKVKSYFSGKCVPDLGEIKNDIPSGLKKVMNDCIGVEPKSRPSWNTIINELKKYI